MKNRVRKTQIVVRDGGRRGVGADRSRSAADRRSRHGHRSGGLAVVVLEQPAEALLADDLARLRWWQASGRRWHVADALVRSALVVVVDEFADEVVQVVLTEHDEVVEALLLERLHEPLGVRRRPCGCTRSTPVALMRPRPWGRENGCWHCC